MILARPISLLNVPANGPSALWGHNSIIIRNVAYQTWSYHSFSMFFVARVFASRDGTYPGWLLAFQGGIFTVMWATHDWLLKPFIGNGEMSDEGVKEA